MKNLDVCDLCYQLTDELYLVTSISNNGGLKGVGSLLLTMYEDSKKAKVLISQGDLTELGVNFKKTSQNKGDCLYYSLGHFGYVAKDSQPTEKNKNFRVIGFEDIVRDLKNGISNAYIISEDTGWLRASLKEEKDPSKVGVKQEVVVKPLYDCVEEAYEKDGEEFAKYQGKMSVVTSTPLQTYNDITRRATGKTYDEWCQMKGPLHNTLDREGVVEYYNSELKRHKECEDAIAEEQYFARVERKEAVSKYEKVASRGVNKLRNCMIGKNPAELKNEL